MLVIIAWLPRLNFFVLLPLVLRIKETSSITTLINNKLSARIYFPTLTPTNMSISDRLSFIGQQCEGQILSWRRKDWLARLQTLMGKLPSP